MKIGDYVRTKKRGFQFSQIARITNMVKDYGYKNQYFIELDHNLLPDMEYTIYGEDIDKSSPDIKDLIKVGDIIKYHPVQNNYVKTNILYKAIKNERELIELEYDITHNKKSIISIVTKEQFESMEYKVKE